MENVSSSWFRLMSVESYDDLSVVIDELEAEILKVAGVLFGLPVRRRSSARGPRPSTPSCNIPRRSTT